MESYLYETFIAALESLSRADRQLLTLYELEGVRTAAVSSALGITPSQARIGLFHARRAMRQLLAERLRAGGLT